MRTAFANFQLVIVVAAAAFFFVIIFVTAITDTSEFRAAIGAFNMIEVCVFVDADGIAATGAFHFNEIVVAIAAIAIVIVAITAVAIVFTVEFFFEHTEVFVDFFDVGIEVFSVFLEGCNFLCEVSKNVEDRVNDLIIHVQAFGKTFDVSNFFRNVHICIHPFIDRAKLENISS